MVRISRIALRSRLVKALLGVRHERLVGVLVASLWEIRSPLSGEEINQRSELGAYCFRSIRRLIVVEIDAAFASIRGSLLIQGL